MAQGEKGFTQLMTRKVRRILLVCNNYDSFALEEDGHIEDQIAREYEELTLSNPPSVTRVESTIEALELAGRGEKFDMVITMYNVGEVDVFEFSRRMKEFSPDTPIVLIAAFSKEIYRKIAEKSASCIDYFFCWNNSADLIIAIVKLLEDKLNADHDILEGGVRAILLVEDSVLFYSTYLPMLYKLVLQQNRESLKECLNEQQQTMRKRSRPKILMATNYTDAVNLYERYKENILGVISDVGFVIHKDDKEEKMDAGIDLCRKIKQDNRKMPFLMQSSQESMREIANQLGVGFVMKKSKILNHEIADYISHEFGFGDFVVTDRKTGKEYCRAKDLYQMERIMDEIPDEEMRRIDNNNYLSKWLLARGIFSLAKEFQQITLNPGTDIDQARERFKHLIHDYRIGQGLGVVAQFNPETYNDTIWFSKMGSGALGGKARGLAFLNHILQKYDLYDKWEDIKVMVPRTVVITTEYFDRFIRENGLKYVINSEITDSELLSEFAASTLPQDLTNQLRVFIHHVKKPLAIRSSSLLEDSYYQPFAGVYSTYMIPQTDNEDQQLRLLSKAIKSVYASVFFGASRAYITAAGHVISEEKMSIVLEEICGSEDGGYFFPTFSGVARSVNFYPIGHEKAEDGIVKLAFGLGKAVVDGDQVLRFSPKYPKHVLQTSTPDLTMRETQQSMFAMDVRPDKFKTSIDDSVNLERINISECLKFRNFARVASTWDYENMRIVDNVSAKGPKCVTFAHILKYGTFPLPQIIRELLEIASKEIKCGVEIEFAANMDVADGQKQIFNVLQIRPISVDSRNAEVNWEKIDTTGAMLQSGSALGTGWINGVKDVVYLKAGNFDTLKTREMASEITAINARMREEDRDYVLIGFGRWGSSIPSLGVPVKWSDISEAKVIVEAALDNFRIDPSQGTHFFQNLTSFNVGYINVNSFDRMGDSLDFKMLDSMPAVEETEFVRHVRFDSDLSICIDGREGKAVIIP